MSLSKREMILLGLLIVVGGFYLAYHFVLEPRNITTNQLKAENSKMSSDLKTLEQKMNQQGDIGQEEQKILNEYTKMLVKLPQAPMIPNTIDFMELSAQQSNVKLLSIDYKDNVNSKPAADKNSKDDTATVKTAEFKISASGSHNNLISFLLKLENAPRIYVINRSKIAMAKKDSPETSPAANTPQQESDTAQTVSVPEVIQKESQTLDPNKSIINIDLTAYYDNPSTVEQNPAVSASPNADSGNTLKTSNNTAPTPNLENSEKKPTEINGKKASDLIHNMAEAAIGLKERAFLAAGNAGLSINGNIQMAKEDFRKLPEFKNLISTGAAKLREIAWVIINQPKLDADMITFLPEYHGSKIMKVMYFSGL